MGKACRIHEVEVHAKYWKEQSRRQCRRWEDNIKIDLKKKIGMEAVDWINPPQYRDQWRALVSMEINFLFP
jgi:hypothetical protein